MIPMLDADLAAVLIYVSGIAATAAWLTRALAEIEEADPLLLCDECRDLRRGWLSVGPKVAVHGDWLVAALIVGASASWPVIVPRRLWRKARRGAWRHVCGRGKPARDGSDHG